MRLIDRISKTVFKTTLNATVDYHAGGFFVKKQVSYLIFIDKENAILYQREEGVHPNDNNFELLLNEIKNNDKEDLYKISQPNIGANILKLSNSRDEVLCMPSIFSENIFGDNLTEIILDNKTTHRQTIYCLAYKIS